VLRLLSPIHIHRQMVENTKNAKPQVDEAADDSKDAPKLLLDDVTGEMVSKK